ncbi:SRPBCC family protein [Undibacterium fentianense]|uniref:SRPBCC domain-containing protein n=1 Tax=Undibacterium fentianense TaxID=2828728 RepID=A0A941IEB0_9BURK|nr:SRPBCC family protein [Undibacterium fentianense]MBR7800898.1 SRPBCC domain-containing protein [Undibacterium fentianense]
MSAKANEIHLVRVYDAPVELVWDAWTDPLQAAQWWGPRGFTLTTHSKDLRVGGTWRYTMHGPDGTDYPNIATYHEIELYQRLVYDHGATEISPPLFRVTVLFSKLGKKTQMEMTMALASAEAAAETRRFIKQAGGDATWDRFAEYLCAQVEHKERFFINRSFAAPIDVLYDMWTQPDHLAKWSPPTGFTMKFIHTDIRVGGSSFYMMSNGDAENAVRMYGRAAYLELNKPNRLVYTQQFCDEHENITRHPMAPTWPETMLTTIQFTAETENQTRVTLMWEPYGTVTAEEMATFISARGGMTMGWTGSFDQLEAQLKK